MGIFTEMIIDDLKQKQSLSLEDKILYSKNKIHEFVERVGGVDKVFISFSGGKDSTVLLHLVRQCYPEIPGVFFDTGLEYPEVREFTKSFTNIIWRKPRKTVSEVWREHGIPCVSKEQSNYIYDVRQGEGNTKYKRLNYRGGYNISKKWIFLTDKQFTNYEPSHHCCKYFKKLPSDDYVKESGRYPIIGTLAEESQLRLNSWVRHGCNMFDGKKIQSRPLSIWTESDIWDYINLYNIDICSLYYNGHKRTGCFCCPYGAHLDKSRFNKFELLKHQHPHHYKALDKLGIKQVLADMNVPIRNDSEYELYRQKRQKEIKNWYEQVQKDIEEHKNKSKYSMYYKYFQ